MIDNADPVFYVCYSTLMKMADLKAIEHSTLKVPYEILNKKFRHAQKVIDKEVSHINTDLNELSSHTNMTKVSGSLTSIVEKLRDLKRKAMEAVSSEEESAKSCKMRLEHLKEHSDARKNAQIAWKRKRLDRMVIDHFLRLGYYESAVLLAEKAEVKDLVDIDLFLAARKVEDALRMKNSEPCLAWCHENKSKLRKMKSTLELNIRIQEFVELIRENRRSEAVMYARKHFSFASGDTQSIPEIQRTMGLLAFKPNCKCQRYQELFSNSRWEDLVEQFRKENFALHQLNSQSMLEVTLQCGLACLKTPHCYHEDENSTECPVCNRLFNDLARHLPFAHCAQSRLICNLTGEAINEHNPPMMLPNGYVYGENALQAMSLLSDDGMVQCPRTKAKYRLEEAQRVYVM